MQNLINKYAFIFEKANVNDIVNLFLFCQQAKIEIPYPQEECMVEKLRKKDDPILWATYLIYSKYNDKYFKDIKVYIENTLVEKIDSIRVDDSIYEYREFWWILIFNKCPLISPLLQTKINVIISNLYVPQEDGCPKILIEMFKNYLINNPEQFFDWDINKTDFLRTLTFKTDEKSLFKNYKQNAISLAWQST